MKSISLERVDTMSTKLNQLHALLASILGAGFESFSELAPTEQENLLWLAADLTSQARDALHNGEQPLGEHGL